MKFKRKININDFQNFFTKNFYSVYKELYRYILFIIESWILCKYVVSTKIT